MRLSNGDYVGDIYDEYLHKYKPLTENMKKCKRLLEIVDEIKNIAEKDILKYNNENLRLHEWLGLINEEYLELTQAINETVPGTKTDKSEKYGGYENIINEAKQVVSLLLRFVAVVQAKHKGKKLTQEQNTILEMAYAEGYRYLTTDQYGIETFFTEKPFRDIDLGTWDKNEDVQAWTNPLQELGISLDLTKWEDEEPKHIADLIYIVDWDKVELGEEVLVKSDIKDEWRKGNFVLVDSDSYGGRYAEVDGEKRYFEFMELIYKKEKYRLKGV